MKDTAILLAVVLVHGETFDSQPGILKVVSGFTGGHVLTQPTNK